MDSEQKASSTDHGKRSMLFDIRYFLLLAGCLAAFFALTTPKIGETIHTISDSRITMTGDWRTVDLDRYDRRSADFARSVGSTFSAELDKQTRINSLDIRIYSYGGGTNKISINLGAVNRTLTYGDLKGIDSYLINFNPPISTNKITISVEQLGQPSFLVDRLTVRSSGFDTSRVLFRMGLGILLSVALYFVTALTISPKTSSGRIYSSIDSLRGIAVLLVLALHSTGYSGLPQFNEQPFLRSFTKHGHFGVEIFYVVSAYTLTFSLFSAVRRRQESLIGMFWSRRINRILPTFLFVILVAFLFRNFISSAWPNDMSIISVLWRYATMTYIFDRDVLRSAFGHSVLWSISTEFQFYLLMPVLMIPLVKRLSIGDGSKLLYVSAGLIAVGSILATAWSREMLSDKPWTAYTLFYHVDAFMIGIAAALVVIAKRRNLRKKASDLSQEKFPAKGYFLQNLPEYIAISSLLGLAIIVAFSTQGGKILDLLGGTEPMRPERLFVVLMCALVILISEWAERQGAQLKALKGLRTIGVLSFIVYLVHVPTLQFVGGMNLPGVFGTDSDRFLATFVMGLIVSLIIAVGIHRLIELPAAKLNRLAETLVIYRSATSIFVLIIAGCLITYLAGA